MPIGGAGVAGAGSSYAGFGTPASGPTPPAQAPLNCVLIDPASRAYLYDAGGNRVQETTAQQMVYLACLTIKNTSAQQGFGLEQAPSVIGDKFIGLRTSQYQTAFAPLQKAGIAQLLSLQIDRVGPGLVIETVRWQDLTTLQQNVVQF